MGFYQERMLPCLTDLAMRQGRLTPYRSRVVRAATGRVLEIGIGSGLNLPFYSKGIAQVLGLDPSRKLLEMTRDAATRTSVPLEVIEGSAEDIPIDNRSIDTVVTTWTLCSIREVRDALAEMRRVLKPGGQLLFVEHGRAPEPRVQWWQDHLTPIWKHLAGGCHFNRPISELIQNAGFRIERLRPKLVTFMYEGSARPH